MLLVATCYSIIHIYGYNLQKTGNKLKDLQKHPWKDHTVHIYICRLQSSLYRFSCDNRIMLRLSQCKTQEIIVFDMITTTLICLMLCRVARYLLRVTQYRLISYEGQIRLTLCCAFPSNRIAYNKRNFRVLVTVSITFLLPVFYDGRCTCKVY